MVNVRHRGCNASGKCIASAEAFVLAAKPRKVIRWVTPVLAAQGQRKAVQSRVQRIAYCMIECQPRVTGLVLGLGRCAH